MNNKPPLLQLVEIDHYYRDSDNRLIILDAASFSLNHGEMVALVAPSGAGKSTLLHIAGLLERPKRGEVLLEGRACGSLSDTARTRLRRADIGFVYQFHHLLPEFNALENVMIPQMIAGLSKHEASERALRLLEYLRIGERARHRPGELSGGEQQRVALDPQTSDYVFRALAALVRQSGLAALIATHNHALAAQMDRRITLSQGKIVEMG